MESSKKNMRMKKCKACLKQRELLKVNGNAKKIALDIIVRKTIKGTTKNPRSKRPKILRNLTFYKIMKDA